MAPGYIQVLAHVAAAEPMTAFRVVGAGIDSLYISGHGSLKDSVLHQLVEAQVLAALERENRLVSVGDRDFIVYPRGWRNYPIWLTSPRYEVMAGAVDPFPVVYLQLHASYIGTVGIDDAAADADELIRLHLLDSYRPLVASRVDLRADTQGLAFGRADLDRFVCLGRARRGFEHVHEHGRRFTGFMFGRDDIVARVYDKSFELVAKGRTWPELLWAEAERDQSVWRVEFQYRRQALRRLHLDTPAQALAHRQALWEFGTRWLSLRTPSNDQNRARWPLAPEWKALQAVQIGSPSSILIPERLQGDDERRLVRGFLGYATSLAAAGPNDDLDAVVGHMPAVRRYVAERGLELRDIIRRKRRRRLLVRGRGQAPQEAGQ